MSTSGALRSKAYSGRHGCGCGGTELIEGVPNGQSWDACKSLHSDAVTMNFFTSHDGFIFRSHANEQQQLRLEARHAACAVTKPE